MKALFTLALALSSPAAFAASTYCSNTSNSDYVLTVVTAADGTVTQVSLENMDWGQAGVGAPQNVLKTGTNQYVVSEEAMSQIAFRKGTTLSLSFDKDGSLEKVDAADETYLCK